MKVRCINNSGGRVALSIGKEYEVNFESANKYRVVNDVGIITEYIKDRFKVVNKENVEKTVREFIIDNKEGEIWEAESGSKMYLINGNIIMDFKEPVTTSRFILKLNSKLKLKRKEYTFEEAFKAYEEGKEIESCYSQYKYKKEGGLDLYSKTENEWYVEDRFEIDISITGKFITRYSW